MRDSFCTLCMATVGTTFWDCVCCHPVIGKRDKLWIWFTHFYIYVPCSERWMLLLNSSLEILPLITVRFFVRSCYSGYLCAVNTELESACWCTAASIYNIHRNGYLRQVLAHGTVSYICLVMHWFVNLGSHSGSCYAEMWNVATWLVVQCLWHYI